MPSYKHQIWRKPTGTSRH